MEADLVDILGQDHLLGVGHPLGLVLVESAVVVAVQELEQPAQVIMPAFVERLAVHMEVQPEQDRALLAEVDDILDAGRRPGLGPLRRLVSRKRPPNQQPGSKHSPDEGEAAHASTSLIGWAVLSAMRMGRPTLELFCLVGSMPRARCRRWPAGRAR